jgi:protein-S-isoprenylcysteine O-methyltransferase Ste14
MTSPANNTGAPRPLGNYQHLRRIWLFVALLIVGLVLLFVQSAWQSEFTYRAIQFCSIGLIWAGILGRLWSILYIGGRKALEVVTTGPYSMTRNPLYFFSAIASIGVGGLTGSLIIAALAGIFCVIAFLIVIKREEEFLGGTFGKPYADYCARVPRFFPALSLFKDEDSLEVSLRRVYSTFLDGLVFFAALPLFALVSYLQNSGYLPVLLRLY